MEKWLIPTLEQEMVNRALGNLLFKKKKRVFEDRVMSKECKSKVMEVPTSES